MAEVEEEVKLELEAVKAVYEDACTIFDSFPPHLRVHIKPRTADISSQQFVEAVVSIRVDLQYPRVPPIIDLIESKGLDERRQKHLITSIQDKAYELSSCSMLVALCEEAVERLSDMNHPDGDCPLCLYPLVPEDEQNKSLPFMKLMSCFHCFHSECIIRWWNWLLSEKEGNAKTSTEETVGPARDPGIQKDPHSVVEESMGNCPVCRKVFHVKDFEHVLHLVGSHSSQWAIGETEVNKDDKLLQSESENIRRQRFEATFKLQEENSGLIEPQKNLAILPGMFPPQPVTSNSIPKRETTDQQEREPATAAVTNSSSSSSRPSSSSRWNRDRGMRKQRLQNSRHPVRQWIRKDNNSAD